MGRFVLEDLLLFALSVSGVASTSGEKDRGARRERSGQVGKGCE